LAQARGRGVVQVVTMALNFGSVLFGAVLGASLVAVVFLFQGETQAINDGPHGRKLMGVSMTQLRSSGLPADTAPHWDGVLPNNIIDQQIPLVRNAHYGVHAVALGKNGSLYHKYQTGPANVSAGVPYVPMTEWLVLTPETYKNTSGIARPLTFGNAPAIALNADGRIELFVGYAPDSLDVWQMYQTDAKNPLAWSTPRAPFCDPSFADCKKCLAVPACKAQFWSDGYTWTTSQQALWLNTTDNKLRLTWRNFDGHIYEKTQASPSNSTHWGTDGVQYPVFE